MVEEHAISGFSLERFRVESFLAAKLARRFSFDINKMDEAFTAALLHDIGRLIIGIAFPRQFSAIEHELRGNHARREIVEREALGFTHAEAGAYLLGLWGLPFSIVEAVAFHHRPSTVAEAAPHRSTMAVKRGRRHPPR